ncbi:MAG: elongation factor Ts [Oscillospiraceae bacterium]|nr:elongation factor Ts [Oscillospiraceae bacterium]MBQ3999584.1 elongation factor Ts [Oscillospiraceae bacterium]MBQ5412046.1 elongation factor Ts [Oscillospiraceae bacterium]
MAFTAKDVQALRERTGCGMMDCKKALTEAEGDMDKAIEILRERGLAAQTKKAGRIAAEGVVFATSSENVGVILEVNSETDFVAKNDKFMDFVRACAEAVIKNDPADVDALLQCNGGEGTIEEMLRDRILTIGENIKIRRFERVEGVTVPYIHMGGVYATLVKFETSPEIAAKPEFVEFGKDIAMQVAAINPTYLNEEEVPAEVIENEKEVRIAQLKQDPKNANKPQNILDKIVVGGLNKYFKEVCLLDQPFVKDDKMSVKDYVAKTAKELGGDIKVVKFLRYEKGEGLEKRNEDFAAEVAAQINK